VKVKYRKNFEKDISKIRQQFVFDEIFRQITAVKECKSLVDFIRLPGVTKLVGHTDCYRIKFGDYRIGIKVIDNIIHFARFGTRSNIYKVFP